MVDRPVGSVIMGRVRGVDCQTALFGPEPSTEIALEKLKQDAANMGATGISNLKYAIAGITVSPACSRSAIATALAYHVNKAE